MLTSSWFVDCCKQVTDHKENIWVAYSGGVDSHVLLSLAVANFSNVRAVHINHNLGPDDHLWQQHCEQVCRQLNIPLECITVNAKVKYRQSPEEAARLARRKAWLGLITSQDLLLLAHHADDQAETILYRLFRGTGPKGLGGMRQQVKIGETTLFRPLLHVSKQEILDYAHQQNLVWAYDQTNSSTNYDRNYIRNQIMPLLTKRWLKAISNINRAGELCAQLLHVVEPVIAEQLASIYGANNSEIEISKLHEFSDYIIIELLRAWLQAHGLTPSLNQINLIQKQVIAAKVDAKPKFCIEGKVIRRSNNKLYISNNENQGAEIQQEIFEQEWDLKSELALPNGQFLNPDQFAQLRGQKVLVKLGRHGRKAKKIFQEHNIPPWERAKYPVILADEHVVCIVGLWNATTANQQ